ncbi:unnamed protein product, partial [Polarella glacialis]
MSRSRGISSAKSGDRHAGPRCFGCWGRSARSDEANKKEAASLPERKTPASARAAELLRCPPDLGVLVATQELQRLTQSLSELGVSLAQSKDKLPGVARRRHAEEARLGAGQQSVRALREELAVVRSRSKEGSQPMTTDAPPPSQARSQQVFSV